MMFTTPPPGPAQMHELASPRGKDFLRRQSIARSRTTAIELLLHVGRADIAARRPRSALHAAEQGLRHDDLNEALWQIAMRALADLAREPP